MRAYEFITNNTVLREYKRDITAKNWGDKLYTRFMAERFYNQQAIINDLDSIISSMTIDQRKPYILNILLQKLESSDPSPNKQYVQWLIRTYLKRDWALEDVTSVVSNDLRKFYELTRRNLLKPEHRDINKLGSFMELYDLVAEYEHILPKKEVERGESKEIYKDNNVRIIQPLDTNAACYYGQGTRWCTAATGSTNYFNAYSKDGPLYILLPQQPNHAGEKYQLHFQSSQYMNENDEPVNIRWLLKERFKDLDKVFLELIPNLATDIQFAPDDILSEVWDKVGLRFKELFDREFEEWAENDYDYKKWLKNTGATIIEEPDIYMNLTTEGDIDIKSIVSKYPVLSYDNYDKDIKKVYKVLNNIINSSVDEIRRIAFMISSNESEDLWVPQIPFIYESMLKDNNVLSHTAINSIRKRVNVVWTKSNSYSDIKKDYYIHKDYVVGDYIIGELTRRR